MTDRTLKALRRAARDDPRFTLLDVLEEIDRSHLWETFQRMLQG